MVVDGHNVGAKGPEHVGSDGPGGAVGAVQGHLFAPEGVYRQGDQIAHVPVPAGGVVHDGADPVAGGEGQFVPGLAVQFQAAVQIILQQTDGALVHFLALPVEQLDAVVPEGIVGGGDHHAAVEAVHPRHIGHGGGGGHVEQIHIRPGGGHARADGVLQHIAGAAGVLAHHDGGLFTPTVVPAQKPPDAVGVVGGQALVGRAPEAVGAEIFAHTIILLLGAR